MEQYIVQDLVEGQDLLVSSLWHPQVPLSDRCSRVMMGIRMMSSVKHRHFLDAKLQEELDLLGTIAARLCRCLCDHPTAHSAQDDTEVNCPA